MVEKHRLTENRHHSFNITKSKFRSQIRKTTQCSHLCATSPCACCPFSVSRPVQVSGMASLGNWRQYAYCRWWWSRCMCHPEVFKSLSFPRCPLHILLFKAWYAKSGLNRDFWNTLWWPSYWPENSMKRQKISSRMDMTGRTRSEKRIGVDIIRGYGESVLSVIIPTDQDRNNLSIHTEYTPYHIDGVFSVVSSSSRFFTHEAPH